MRKLAGAGWVTALNVDTLKAPDIAALTADGGPLPLSLFDEQNLAEITHPDCWYAPATPALEESRRFKREALLAETEADLAVPSPRSTGC